jgi:hypothetical protein
MTGHVCRTMHLRMQDTMIHCLCHGTTNKSRKKVVVSPFFPKGQEIGTPETCSRTLCSPKKQQECRHSGRLRLTPSSGFICPSIIYLCNRLHEDHGRPRKVFKQQSIKPQLEKIYSGEWISTSTTRTGKPRLDEERPGDQEQGIVGAGQSNPQHPTTAELD